MILIVCGDFAAKTAVKLERYQRQLASGVITEAEVAHYRRDIAALARMDSLQQIIRKGLK